MQGPEGGATEDCRRQRHPAAGARMYPHGRLRGHVPLLRGGSPLPRARTLQTQEPRQSRCGGGHRAVGGDDSGTSQRTAGEHA